MELEFGPKKYTSSTSTKEPAILKNAWNLQGQKDPVGTEVGRSYYRQKKYGKALKQPGTLRGLRYWRWTYQGILEG